MLGAFTPNMHVWLQHNFHKYQPYWWQMFPRANAECALAVGLNSLSSHLPSLLPASSLSGTSHLKQSSGNNCHKQKKTVYLVGTAVQMNSRYHGEWGEWRQWMKLWYSYKRMKSIWTKTYLSFLCLCLASLMFFREKKTWLWRFWGYKQHTLLIIID